MYAVHRTYTAYMCDECLHYHTCTPYTCSAYMYAVHVRQCKHRLKTNPRNTDAATRDESKAASQLSVSHLLYVGIASSSALRRSHSKCCTEALHIARHDDLPSACVTINQPPGQARPGHPFVCAVNTGENWKPIKHTAITLYIRSQNISWCLASQ